MSDANDRLILKSLLRNDLSSFTHRVFQTVSPSDRYLDNWHMQAILHYLQLCVEGKITRLTLGRYYYCPNEQQNVAF